MADKLHGNVASILRIQRQIFIAGKPILLQMLQHRPIRLDALEQTEFPHRFADHFIAGKAQQLDQERIRITNAARVHVQNHDPVLRRLE